MKQHSLIPFLAPASIRLLATSVLSLTFTLGATAEIPKMIAKEDAKVQDYFDRTSLGLVEKCKNGTALEKNINDLLAESGTSASTNILGGGLIRGVGLNLAPRYKVGQGLNFGVFYRRDVYTAGISANGVTNGVGPIASLGGQIEFDRFFPDSCDALYSPFYFEKQIPKDTASIKNLNPGDYFSMRSNWALGISVGALKSIGITDYGVGFDYFIAGNFTLQFLKTGADKIKVQAIGNKSVNYGLFAGANPKPNFVIFKVPRIDSAIDRQFNNIASFSIGESDANLFLMDFEADLSDPNVSAAYDKLFAESLKGLKVDNKQESISRLTIDEINADPLTKLNFSAVKDMSNLLLVDLDPIYKVSQSNDKVKFNFQGSNFQTNKGYNLQLGSTRAEIYQIQSGNLVNNRIKSLDKDGNTSYYFAERNTRLSELSFYDLSLKRFKHHISTDLDIFYNADAQFNRTQLNDVFLHIDETDETFSKNAFEKDKLTVSRLVPRSIYNPQIFNRWNPDLAHYQTHFSVEMTLKGAALNLFPSLSESEIDTRFTNYLLTNAHDDLVGLGNPQYGEKSSPNDPQTDETNTLLRNQAWDIKSVGVNCAILFNQSLSVEERAKALDKLTANNLFKLIGVRFLLELLPADQLASLLRIDVVLVDSNFLPVLIGYGNAAMDAKSSLLNDELDTMKAEGGSLLREAEEVSIQNFTH